jgi:ABC-type multidrug transport system permease subunit
MYLGPSKESSTLCSFCKGYQPTLTLPQMLKWVVVVSPIQTFGSEISLVIQGPVPESFSFSVSLCLCLSVSL